MQDYTKQTMEKIAGFFDDRDAALKLLNKYGEVLEKKGHTSEFYMDNLLQRHNDAYIKRQKHGTPNSLVIIENEIMAETESMIDNMMHEGHKRRKQTMSQREKDLGIF